jgi:hypothetical protein
MYDTQPAPFARLPLRGEMIDDECDGAPDSNVLQPERREN